MKYSDARKMYYIVESDYEPNLLVWRVYKGWWASRGYFGIFNQVPVFSFKSAEDCLHQLQNYLWRALMRKKDPLSPCGNVVMEVGEDYILGRIND